MYFFDYYTLFIPNIESIKSYSINLAVVSINKYTEYSLIAQKIYTSNPIIQKTGTIVYNIYLLCHKTIYNYKIEPNITLTGKKINVWINTILYLDDYHNFEESYDFVSIENESGVFCADPSRHPERVSGRGSEQNIQPCLFMYNDIVDKNKYIDYSNYLMIMKFYNSYLVHINMNNDDDNDNKNTKQFLCKPSCVSFLTIQYTHPRQPQPVSIVLPKGMYTVGNELFSPIFVLRCLKYQTQSYYFDMNYSLKIIDNNIEIVKLTSKQYIKIEEKSYKIFQI